MPDIPPFDVLRFTDWRRAVVRWRARDPERTLRWVADKTGVSLGIASETLSHVKRRAPTPVFIGMLGQLMELAPRERRYFEALVRAELAAVESARREAEGDLVGAQIYEDEARVARDEIRVLSTLRESRGDGAEGLVDRWVASVLYELVACTGRPPTEGLARRFVPPVSDAEVREAWRWLIETGLVRVSGGQADRVDERILWYDASDSARELRRKMALAHRRALAHHAWALDSPSVPREARRHRLAFQALPLEMLPEITAKFDEIIAWASVEAKHRGGSEAVYVLGFQAVPATAIDA